MEGKYFDEIKISDELEATLKALKACSDNNYIFATDNSKELYEYIIKLQNEINELDEYVDRLWEDY